MNSSSSTTSHSHARILYTSTYNILSIYIYIHCINLVILSKVSVYNCIYTHTYRRVTHDDTCIYIIIYINTLSHKQWMCLYQKPPKWNTITCFPTAAPLEVPPLAFLDLGNFPLLQAPFRTSWWFFMFFPFEKYTRQFGSFPQVGVKIKNLWNHHLENDWTKQFVFFLSCSRPVIYNYVAHL